MRTKPSREPKHQKDSTARGSVDDNAGKVSSLRKPDEVLDTGSPEATRMIGKVPPPPPSSESAGQPAGTVPHPSGEKAVRTRR